jgi:hypothetical protein
MTPMTSAQIQAVNKIYFRKQTNTTQTPAEFLASAIPVAFADGAYCVHWCGMELIIERDGYIHS